MAFVKEMYSEGRVSMMYELLKKEAGNNAPKDYDISIDELKVVSRNNDPERFYDFEEFILPESKNITINIHEKSHRCLRYILLLKQEDPTTEELSGIERSIVTKMQQEKAKWTHKQLEDDYNELFQKLKECEEYSRQLQDKVNTLEAEKGKTSGQLTSAIVGLAGAYLSSNPNALSGIPVIGSMFGKSKKELPQGNLSGNSQEPCLCKDAPKQFTGEVSVSDDQRLKSALIPYFKEEYREKVMTAIICFFHNNHFIDQAVNGMKTPQQRHTQKAQANN
jgi:hypothetical protein